MGLVIDTGLSEADPLALVPDWLLDQFAEPYDRPRILRAYAEHLVGKMDTLTMPHAMRKQIGIAWRFLNHIRDADPASFDWILTEYVEAITRHASAPGGTGQPISAT